MSALPKDTVAALASTRFEFCDERRTLRAIAVVDAADRAPPASDPLHLLVARLNAATAAHAQALRAGGRFEADLRRRELLLIREFDLAGLTFEDLFLGATRLAHVAEHWCRMRPAHAVATVLHRLASLRDGGAA